MSASMAEGGAVECWSCDEGDPLAECTKAQRDCGHHCNHVWTHDECCWCGTVFDEETGASS